MTYTKPTLVPAYGRDYKSLDLFLADFNAGKDFRAQSPDRSGYTSSAEIREFFPNSTLQVRYDRGNKVAMIKFNEKSKLWRKA